MCEENNNLNANTTLATCETILETNTEVQNAQRLSQIAAANGDLVPRSVAQPRAQPIFSRRYSVFPTVTMPKNQLKRRNSVHSELPIKREPQPVFSACSSHILELEKLLEKSQFVQNHDDQGKQDEDDDFIFLCDTVPLPLASTSEGLIKRENDSISANKPFIETVCFIGFWS